MRPALLCTPAARLARRVALLALLLAPAADAVPGIGAARPAVRLLDGWDRTIDVSRIGPKPMLVLYEDKDSAAQNQAFKEDLSALAKGDRYRSSVSLVPIADVQSYDYWPVRGFVKDAIQEESHRFGTIIYCDWNGDARRAFSAHRGTSNVILYGRDGTVLFAQEGPMSASRREEVITLLRRQVEGDAETGAIMSGTSSRASAIR